MTATQTNTKTKCRRCKGSGFLPEFFHERNDGTCHRCGGSGIEGVSSRQIAEAKEAAGIDFDARLQNARTYMAKHIGSFDWARDARDAAAAEMQAAGLDFHGLWDRRIEREFGI